MSMKRDWVVSGLLVFACAIPALALWRHSSYLTGDSYQYLRGALSFSQGRGLRDMSGNPFIVLTPLYPIVVGTAYHLFANANIETTARLVSFAGATVAVVALYWLMRIRYSLWISLAAAMLFALLPLRVWSSLWALSEGLFVGLLMLGLAAFFRSGKRGWVTCASGTLLGLAYLTRPEATVCFAVLVVFSLLNFAADRKKPALLLAGFLLVALPYHGWVYQATRNPSAGRLQILLAQSQSIYEGNMSRVLVFNQANADGTSTQPLRSAMSLGAIGKRYWFFGRLEIERLLYLLGPHLLVIGLLLAGALFWLWRNIAGARSFQLANPWTIALALWLFFLPFLHVEDRYLLQVAPAFLVWLVLIVAGIFKLVAARLPDQRKTIVQVIPAALLSVFLLSYGYRLATQIPQRDPSLLARGTAHWLEAEKLSPVPILSQTPDLAFFSNGLHLWMPAGEPDHVVKYAEKNGARYIYVSSRDVSTPLNELLLGDSGAAPNSLKLVHEETDGSARSRLFEVNSNDRVIVSNLHL